MNEKIEEIRKRHVKALQTPSDWWTVMGDDANRDRHTLLAEVDRLRAEIERLRADVERLRVVYVLIASRQSGPVDSATCCYEDKIIGCYISREAAEGVAKLLMADWRINEYALVGNP